MSNYTKLATVEVSVDTEKNAIQFHTKGDAFIWIKLDRAGLLNHLVDQLLRERFAKQSLFRTLERFKDPKAMKNKLHHDPLAYTVVTTLLHDADPIHLIEDLIGVIENQRKDIEQYLLTSPHPNEILNRLTNGNGNKNTIG